MNVLRYFLFVFLFAFSGCFQSDTAIFVRPDGSGRIEVSNAMSDEAAEMMAMMAELDPSTNDSGDGETGSSALEMELFPVADLRAAAEKMGKGVRFVGAEELKRDGFVGSVATYEFDDITQVRLETKPDAMQGEGEVDRDPGPAADSEAASGGAGQLEEVVVFALNRDKEVTRLTVTLPQDPDDRDGTNDDANGGDSAADSELGIPTDTELEMLQNMLAGLKFGMRIIPLGTLLETNSIHVSGDEVTLFEIDFDALLKDPNVLKDVASQGEPESFAEMSALLQSIPGIKINPAEEIVIEFRE